MKLAQIVFWAGPREGVFLGRGMARTVSINHGVVSYHVDEFPVLSLSKGLLSMGQFVAYEVVDGQKLISHVF